MLDIAYRSKLLYVLILETWMYISLYFRLSYINFAALTLALGVLLFPPVNRGPLRLLLVVTLPALIYQNLGQGWLAGVPVAFALILLAVFLTPRTAPVLSAVSSHAYDFDDLAMATTPLLSSALDLRTRNPGAGRTIPPRPTASPTGPAQRAHQSVPRVSPEPQPQPHKSWRTLSRLVKPLLVILIGFGIGWFWNPAARTSLSLTPGQDAPYSYLKRSALYFEDKDSLLSNLSLKKYLEAEGTSASPYFRLLTHSFPTISLPRLPQLSSLDDFFSNPESTTPRS